MCDHSIADTVISLYNPAIRVQVSVEPQNDSGNLGPGRGSSQ